MGDGQRRTWRDIRFFHPLRLRYRDRHGSHRDVTQNIAQYQGKVGAASRCAVVGWYLASMASLGILGLAASVLANGSAGMQAPSAGLAADAPSPNEGGASDVEEVVVTATRSKQAVSRVPLSVQAFTQEDTQRAGVKQFQDLVRLSPGLTLNNTFAGGTNIAIRGIGSNAGSATTGIYIDDVPIQVRNLGYSATSIFPKSLRLGPRGGAARTARNACSAPAPREGRCGSSCQRHRSTNMTASRAPRLPIPMAVRRATR